MDFFKSRARVVGQLSSLFMISMNKDLTHLLPGRIVFKTYINLLLRQVAFLQCVFEYTC